jgi:hypothetical protein
MTLSPGTSIPAGTITERSVVDSVTVDSVVTASVWWAGTPAGMLNRPASTPLT